jgi:hypothetical protein
LKESINDWKNKLNILAAGLCCLFLVTWFMVAVWIVLGLIKDVKNLRTLKLSRPENFRALEFSLGVLRFWGEKIDRVFRT